MTASVTTTSKSTNAVYQPPKEVLNSAPPPWHTVALLVLFVAVFLHNLPSLEDVDRIATVETFTTILFPKYLTLKAIGWIRLLIAFIIFATSTRAMLGGAWWQQTTYLPGSKLKKVQNRISGIKTMFPFTSVSWNLLGASFTLSGYIALTVAGAADSNRDLKPDVIFNPWILRTALVLWEIAAPFTLLVAAVIRYAIWPGLLKANGSTNNLKTVRNKLMHNANVLFSTVEIALLGGLPVQWQHFPMAPLVGCAYVVFSWNVTRIWNTREHGPQFIYFFFDTTLGKTASIALFVLLIVLVVFYMFFVAAESILELLDFGLTGNLAFVLLVCSCVMRFRD